MMDWDALSSQINGNIDKTIISLSYHSTFKPLIVNLGRYDLFYRPVNLFPLERSVINTEFILVTQKGRHKTGNLEDKRSLRKLGFSSRLPLKIIIHGFLDHGDVDWIQVHVNCILVMP